MSVYHYRVAKNGGKRIFISSHDLPLFSKFSEHIKYETGDSIDFSHYNFAEEHVIDVKFYDDNVQIIDTMGACITIKESDLVFKIEPCIMVDEIGYQEDVFEDSFYDVDLTDNLIIVMNNDDLKILKKYLKKKSQVDKWKISDDTFVYLS